MALRKLLLPLTGTAADDVALATSAVVARRWNAHVQALYFHHATPLQPFGTDILPGTMITEMAEDADHDRQQRIQQAQAHVEETMARHGVAMAAPAHGQDHPTAAFATALTRPDEMVAQQARLADLTIIPHLDLDEDDSFSDMLHAALFDSGRPVLVAPRRPVEAIGTRVCIAWNGTAESAAGVQAAMPWLHRAAAVRVLTATGYQRRGPEAQALGDYLALHDITAEIATFQPAEKSVGRGLLAAARDFGADLLAMGAYSHPRWRQVILGGVTRAVLEEAALPVLMNR